MKHLIITFKNNVSLCKSKIEQDECGFHEIKLSYIDSKDNIFLGQVNKIHIQDQLIKKSW